MGESQWDEFLGKLKKASDYRNQIVATLFVPAREPVFADLQEPLHPTLQEALKRIGIDRLYQHQAEACDAARRGENVAVFTPTASGKTLCYNLPVLDTLLKDPKARAFYLFPTKALAQDQLRKLQEFGLSRELPSSTYDGDTPTDARRLIRERCRIVLTNPDMLHVGILPNHTVWAHFFRNLRFVCLTILFGHTFSATFASSSLMNFTPIAASSESTSPMSSAGSDGFANFTAAIRSSFALRRLWATLKKH